MESKKESFSKPENSIREIKKLKALIKQQEKTITALKESEERYKTIFDSANDGIILHDLEGKILDVNRSMHQRLGYTKSEFLRMNLNRLVPPEYEEKIESRTAAIKQQGVAIFESADTRKDGTIMPVEVNARIVNFEGRKIIQSVVRDIQERKLAEAIIEDSLKEKGTLLRLMTQSTRFNLNLGSRTLELLERKRTSKEKNVFLSTSIQRLKTIDFIQNRFNRLLNLSKIDIKEIVRSLIGFLQLLYRVRIRDVHIYYNIDNFYLDILKTAPTFYILNELVSNALQHAFPNGRKGKIIVEFKSSNESSYTLTVRDNGMGFPEKFNPREIDSVGFWLIHNMIDELKGTLKIKNIKGTAIQIHFN